MSESLLGLSPSTACLVPLTDDISPVATLLAWRYRLICENGVANHGLWSGSSVAVLASVIRLSQCV